MKTTALGATLIAALTMLNVATADESVANPTNAKPNCTYPKEARRMGKEASPGHFRHTRMDHHGGPGMGHEGFSPMDHGPGNMRALKALDLSDAQEDAIFKQMHAQMPETREKMNAMRDAQKALRDLAASDRFDEAQAAKLADTAGQAARDLALSRAKQEAAIMALLTPEQRQKLATLRPTRGHHRSM